MTKLKLASFAPLDALASRMPCPKCDKMRKYYCFECYCAVGDYEADIPKLDLPVKVTILSHPKEKKSKSSVVPVKILAPEHVDFVHNADAPDFIARYAEEGLEADQVAILFPGENATDVTELNEE